ncbi:MAG: 2-amino-4-hydroxy-6-hydroxymethyldihydropteridine diphosphokinase [Janthinobacterium lividum]
MTVAYLGLGANLGDARQTLKDAVVCLAQQPGITVLAKSSLYRTEPLNAGGDDYYNCVVALGTLLPAHRLLQLCLDLEDQFGRERPYPNAPRTLDLDILLYGDERIVDEVLVIPHPRITTRAFVLVPLLELDADVVIPGHGPAAAFVAGVSSQRIEQVATCQCPTLLRPVRGRGDETACP